MRLASTTLAICLLQLPAAFALEAPANLGWCAGRKQNLSARRAALAAEEPQLKAAMATVFARLSSDIDAVANRAPDLKKYMLDMQGRADDLAWWPEFRNFFTQASERLQSLGRGIPAWDIDIATTLGRKVVAHEIAAEEIRADEPLYTASCNDPPRGASAAAIIDALEASGAREPEVLLYMNLAKEFRTTSTWSLAIVRGQLPRDPEWEHGPLLICFLKERAPTCLDSAGEPTSIDTDARIFLDARIVHASADGQNPRLLIKTCTEPGGNGECFVRTTLYAYNSATDRFDWMFRNTTTRNRNEQTWFVEDGPIRGDIIVTQPTNDAPYTYWVEVHRPRGGQYARILRYRGKTGYADGNRLAVADSEMPELLRRLGLWKSGEDPHDGRDAGKCASGGRYVE